MSERALIFPHQLFEENPILENGSRVVMLEEYLYFKQFNFHAQKLAFHRASMKAYERRLRNKKYRVDYIEAHEARADVRKLIQELAEEGVTKLKVVEVVDDWLEKRLVKATTQYEIKLEFVASPMFINKKDENENFFSNKKKFYHHDFYAHQRKKMGVLMDLNGQPTGGKWSFDSDNRKRYPKNAILKDRHTNETSDEYRESIEYVKENFPQALGEIDESFLYPITHEQAKAEFESFLVERFIGFGTYEDAILKDYYVLNHSLLSIVLNVGLITPHYVLEKSLAFAEKNAVPLNDLEGFVRQIIGWREFIRAVYELDGGRMRTKNFWNFKRSMPKAFYRSESNMPPFDHGLSKVTKTAYSHHIERLMVFGNLMLLCEINPDDVYRWFMELFIDAYDWVMVPNVYGMSQYADGGSMVTKPYISSSNYILKMSDYKKSSWCDHWDGLFWRFMNQHVTKLNKNPRLSMLMKTWDKMSSEKKQARLNSAETYLATLK